MSPRRSSVERGRAQGIGKTIRSETELVLGVYRTELMSPEDIENVKAVQAGYKGTPLSRFAGTEALAPAPALDFPKFDAKAAVALPFFGYRSYLLQFCPTHPSETGLRARFAKLYGNSKEVIMRLYYPKPEALDGAWTAPALT